MIRSAAVLIAGLIICGCQERQSSAVIDSDTAPRDIPQDIKPERAAEWEFSCHDGQRITVAFDHPRQMATVRRSDGLAFDLVRKVATNGYIYEATGISLRGKGPQAYWRSPQISDTICNVNNIKLLN